MKQQTLLWVIFGLFLGAACAVHADPEPVPTTNIVEGTFADTLFVQQKNKLLTLSQKNINFILKKPGMADVDTPQDITVKPGEFFFIRNDETSIEHNIYDDNDTSWLLQKQVPGSVAAIRFTQPGTHHFICAIHPQMQLTVNVAP